MVTAELLNYIKGQISQGKTSETIKVVLLNQGWSETDISQALIQAGTNQPNQDTQQSINSNIQKSSKEYASFTNRLVAVIIDAFITGLIVIILMGIFIFGLDMLLGHPKASTTAGNTANSLVNLFISITPIFILLYYVYFIGSKGQTIEKKIMKIKVVKIDTNEPPGYLSALVRETIGKIISAAIFDIGFLWMLKDPNKQTWHDKLVKTIVIKSE